MAKDVTGGIGRGRRPEVDARRDKAGELLTALVEASDKFFYHMDYGLTRYITSGDAIIALKELGVKFHQNERRDFTFILERHTQLERDRNPSGDSRTRVIYARQDVPSDLSVAV